jgi:multiple sugar transport system substrate-binding protein
MSKTARTKNRRGARVLLGGTATLAAITGVGLFSTTSAGAAGTTTIVWSTISTGTPVMTDIVKAFEAQNPGITVIPDVQTGDSNVVRAQLSSGFASGASTPDVYAEDQTWPGEATLNHWDVNLNSLIPKSYLHDIAPGLLAGYTFKGQLVGVPWFTDSIILYYRKDLLAKAHLSPPKTWSELVTEAKQLQSMKLAKYGLIYFGANFEGTTMFFTSMVADAGGGIMNSGDTAATIDSHAGLEALNFLNSTVTSGITPHAVATFGATTPGSVFDEGQTAFMVANEYQWPGVRTAHLASDVGFSAIPTFTAGAATGPAATGGSANYINPNSKHLQADVKFIEFMTSLKAELLVSEVGGLAPSSSAAQTNSGVDAADPPAALLPHLTLVNRPAQEKNYPGVTEAIASNVNAVLAGISTPSSAAAKMSSQIDAALKAGA